MCQCFLITRCDWISARAQQTLFYMRCTLVDGTPPQCDSASNTASVHLLQDLGLGRTASCVFAAVVRGAVSGLCRTWSTISMKCGTFNMGSRAAWIAAFCVLAFSTHIAEAYVHTQVSSMSKDCQTRYADLIASIPVPADPEDEASCHDVIVNATDNTSGVDCPASDTLVACFQMNQTTWRQLVNDCDLFSPAPNCISGGVADAQTGNDCQRPRQSNSYWLTSLTEGKYAIERYDYDTGIMPNAGSDWRTVQGEGSRRLLATPYLTYNARRRRALLQGESEGGGAGRSAGCFPDIYTAQDFENWLDGSYTEPTFGGNSINPIGVIFWIVHFFGVMSMAAF